MELRGLNRWVWWLATACLLLLLVWLLWLPRLSFNNATASPQGYEGLDEEMRLRRHLAGLQEQLHAARLACRRTDCDGAPPSLENQAEDVCERMTRELGHCDLGDLSFALVWNTRHDLDLQVITPAGARINFRQRQDGSGGFLRLDVNQFPTARTDKAVEVIAWSSPPPSGDYRVEVQLYDIDRRHRHINPVPFTVFIAFGDRVEKISGEISHHPPLKRWHHVSTFTVP